MKRASYFISAQNLNTDAIAADLMLALKERFASIDALGFLGPAMQKARHVEDVETPKSAPPGIIGWENESQTIDDPEEIKSYLVTIHPKLAVIVGWSDGHATLIEELVQANIEIYFYHAELSFSVSSACLDLLKDAKAKILGAYPQAGKLYRSRQLEFTYVGTPQYDQVARVFVSHDSIGLKTTKPVLAVLPGNTPERFNYFFPKLFANLCENSKLPQKFEIIVSISNHLIETAPDTVKEHLPADLRQWPFFEWRGARIVKGMETEILALSCCSLVVSPGASVVAALTDSPHLLINSSKRKEPRVSLEGVNAILEEEVVEKVCVYHQKKLQTKVTALADDYVSQQRLKDEFKKLKSMLHCYAAENAAEVISLRLSSRDHVPGIPLAS